MGISSDLEALSYMKLQKDIIKCFKNSGALDSSSSKTLEELGITRIKNPEALESLKVFCESKDVIQVDDRYWLDLAAYNKYRWIAPLMLAIITVISLGYVYYIFTTQA